MREAVPELAQATDARIIGLIKQASKIVDGFIGRRLGRARLIEAIDVGGDQMLLHYLPIVQLHAAGREGEPVEIETLEVLSFDYGVVLDLNNFGPATGVQGLWRWVRAARWAIEYTGGYALPG
ncbi:MAG: hypothetical protein RML32_10145, partial [Gammaproteobacteria bacterium]|nr:hypothetical protein [Gammaproteobacteria bacterium]